MRSLLFIATITLSLTAVPHFAHAAIPFFGPIIPAGYLGQPTSVCAGGWGLVMVVVNNLISFLLTITIVFVTPLMGAYAGFLFVVNPVSAEGKEHAKKILLNTIVGIILALASWLIVDAVMAVLYNSGAQSGGTTLGTWSSLVTTSGGDICIKLAAGLAPGAPPAAVPPVTVTPGAADEQSIRQIFANAGVRINHQPCDPSTADGAAGKNCTNVANMQQATIQQIVNIAAALGCSWRDPASCPVEITGGTEPGHAPPSAANNNHAHGNGYKVDLHSVDPLNN